MGRRFGTVVSDHRCRCCGAAGLTVRLDRRAVPVENSRLLTSAAEAAAVPRGDLLLEQCDRCGFVQNSAFDPALVTYDDDYLSDQSGSPYFRAFADRIVAELVERFDLAGATTLEIGCGGGEFLERVCAATRGPGFGLDPVAPAGRSGAAVQFRREAFGSGSGDFGADLVVCRHTLEHLPEVEEFLCTLRGEFAARPDAVLCLEIPDAGRILAEGAFWDLYYEHCSYLDRAGLEALLIRTGFEVVECRLDYGDQYLLAFARPCAEPVDVVPDRAVGSFAALDRSIDRWRTWAVAQAAAGTRVALWAASSKAVAFQAAIEELPVVAAVDVNPAKAGRYLPVSATPVVAPDDIPRLDLGTIVVMNPLYVGEIRAMLRDLGVEAELLALEP